MFTNRLSTSSLLSYSSKMYGILYYLDLLPVGIDDYTVFLSVSL